MNSKKTLFGLLIVVIVGSGYYFYTQNINNESTIQDKATTLPESKEKTVNNTTVIDEKTEEVTKPVTAPAGFKTYTNNDFGFSFDYPDEYGNLELKKFTVPGKPNLVQFSIFSFINNKSSDIYLPVTIQGNEYDSGKDTVAQPLCPKNDELYNCEEKYNKNDALYYEFEVSDIAGTHMRFEFPLSSNPASLVVSYYKEDTSSAEIKIVQDIVGSISIEK